MKTNFNILSNVDWNVLNNHIDNNNIIANKHPDYDLWILNYSPKVQSKQLWDDYTIACRGMVVDADGTIVARPLRKFKNLEEYHINEIDFDQKFEVFEKMDGSLIILFYYEPYKEWIIASRGSFISEQAKEAEKMFDKSLFKHLNTDFTYLFEVIYPENRIVVDYGNTRDLVLLTAVNTKTGAEIKHSDLLRKYSFFSIVSKHEIKSFKKLKEIMEYGENNREGFVIRFENGFRVKMKFEEYVRLHAILTNVSNLTIWEHMMNGYDFNELTNRVPDEFYTWLNRTREKIQCDFNEIERRALKEFVRIVYINEIVDRKNFAEEAKPNTYRSILFKMYDRRSYDEIIWKMIRPTYSKPFAHGYDSYNW